MNEARRQEIEAAVRFAVEKARDYDWEIAGQTIANQIVKETMDTFPKDEGVDEVRSVLDAGNGRFEVFTVIERNNKSYWSKLGRGYLNKDRSINIFLDALPLNGKLQVRHEANEVPK